MNDFAELRQIIATVIKWLWLIALATVIAAAVGFGASQRQTPVYQSTATLMVGQSIQTTNLDSKDIQTSERLALTYGDVARRQPVLQGVIDALNLPYAWQSLKKRVRVKPVQDTQLLEITVEAGSPEEAQLIADEVAHQLILLSPTTLESREKVENQRFVGQRLENLQAKIEGGQARVDELETEMTSALSAEQMRELQGEIDTLERLITDWETNYTQLLLITTGEKSPNYLAVIEPAQANPNPIRPRVQLNTILAGAVGFILALGLIFLLELLDDTLKSAEDLSQSLDLPPLGVVSRFENKRYQSKLVTYEDPFSPASEAYRLIRSNIQFMAVDRPVKAIMVTSPGPAEGKSTTAANLGMVMAQADLKTIVVDADLRRPTQHQIFEVLNWGGLTDLLCSPNLEVEEFLRDTSLENLHVITSGVLPPNPSELLGSRRMEQLLARLTEMADVIIFDSPPATVADTAVLSNRVDGVVLVTQAGQTRRDAARHARLNLQQAGGKLFGVVLNQVSPKSDGSYYHAYYSPGKRNLAGEFDSVKPNRWRQWRQLLDKLEGIRGNLWGLSRHSSNTQ